MLATSRISVLVASSLLLGAASNLRAQPTGMIGGRVTSEATGLPLSGITVQVEVRNGPGVGQSVTDIYGDYAVGALENGTYVVRVFSGNGHVGELWDGINEFDYDLATPVVIDSGESETGRNFALAVAGSVSGSIGSGLNVGQSVNVNLEDMFNGRYRGGANSDPNTFAYTIPNLPPGTYRLRVNPGGTDRAIQFWNGRTRRADADAVDLTPGQAVSGKDFALAQGGTISGQVSLSPAGNPQPMWIGAQDLMNGEWIQTASVNPDGTYQITNLPAGAYVVRVETLDTGYVSEYYSSAGPNPNADIFSSATPASVSAGGVTAPINLTLERGGSVSGRVFLDDGDNLDQGEPGVPDANVNANQSGPCCFGRGTRTDGSGNFTITGLRPGAYTVNAQSSSPDHPFVEKWWNNRTFLDNVQDFVNVMADQTTPVHFGVVVGQVISGVVCHDVNGDGICGPTDPPLQSATVRASTDSRCCTHTQIGADGRYALAVPPGTYRVDAWVWSSSLLREYWNSNPAVNAFFFNQATPLTPPQTGVDFTLLAAAPFGTIRGELRDAGQPVPGVDVHVQLWSDGSGVASGRTGSDGRFVISGLPPAEYRLLFDTRVSNAANNQDLVAEYWTRCQTEVCPPGVIDPNDLKVAFPASPAPLDGPGADLGVFSLTPGGSIEGTVDVAGGGALPLPFNVQIQSFVSGGPSQPFLPGAAVQSGGAYRIRGVPAPLAYKVQAGTNGTDYVAVYFQNQDTSTYDNNLAGPVEVSVGNSARGIDLHLYLGGSISGHVTCAGGTIPVQNFPVQIDRMWPGGYWLGTRTDSNGDYIARGLPAGQYSVRADARGQAFGSCGVLANETYPGSVTVVEGSESRNIHFDLAAGSTISGRVTQIVNGSETPVVNMRVSASDSVSGQFVSDAHTDANGDYVIGSVATGTAYRLRVEARDHSDDPQFFNFIQEYYDNTIFWSAATAVTAPAVGRDFTLDLGGAISGIVTADGPGTPISGVNVCAEPFVGGGFNNCDRTDQNGFYIIRGLPAGEWRMNANASPQNYVFEYYNNSLFYNLATPVPVAVVPPGGPAPITSGINFSLATGRSIQGRIYYDANGDGIQTSGEPGLPGICLNATTPDNQYSTGACSDANGDYTTSGVPPGTYVVNVYPQAMPYAAEYFKMVGGRAVGTTAPLQADPVDVSAVGVTGIDFSLVLGGSIKGLVRDQATTLALANVQVCVNAFVGQGAGGCMTTGPDGLYEVGGLPAGDYRVNARDNSGAYIGEWHPDALFSNLATAVAVSARTSPSDVGSDVTINFDLSQGVAIEGDVYDDANGNGFRDAGEAAVVNANFSISEFASPNRCCLGSGGTTDGNGHFRIGGLPANLALRAYASPPSGSDLVAVFYDGGDDEKGSSSPASITVASGTRTGVNFALQRGGAIEGVVYHDLDGDGFKDPGEPLLQGVNINVSTAPFCCFGQDRQSDGNGHFRVRGVPAGSYRVQASPSGSSDFVAVYYDGGNDQGALVSGSAVLVPVSVGGTATANFGLNLGASVAGVVYQDLDNDGSMDAGEAGLANVPINANVKIGTQFLCCFGNGNRSTDSTGAYRLRGIPAALPAGLSEIRLQVNASPSSNPTDLVSIWWDGGDDKGPTVQSLAVSLFPGAGEQLAGFNFAVSLGGSISGFLRDGNGNPIANFCCLNAQPLAANVSGRSSFNTSSTGAYTIRGLVPGSYRVSSGTPAGLTSEWWNNQVDSLAADPVMVPAPSTCGASGLTGCATTGIDFYLTQRPQSSSVLSQSTGAQGTTRTGVQLAAVASSLLGAACGAAPCSRVEVGGTGVTVQNLSLGAGVFAFDLVIAAGAPLGVRSVVIVNDYTVAGEDTATVIPNAFEVTAGGTPFDSPERIYVTNNEAGELRVYGAIDNALLGRIDVCCQPGGVALQGSRLAYVTGGDRSLAVVDLELGQEVFRTTSLGSFGPGAVAVTPNYIYVLNREGAVLNNRVQVYDAVSWESKGYILVGHSPFPVGANPFSLRLDPSGRLWVVNGGASNTPRSVTIIDTTVDPSSPNARLATLSFPAGFNARGVAFGPDFDGPGPRGPYAYVIGAQNTYVLDTALVLGADPSLAFIDVDGDTATGLPVGSRTGISPLPTRGGGGGVLTIATLPGDGRTVAYVPEFAQVRVIDLSTNPDRPRFVKTFSAGVGSSNGIRASADGSRVFFSYGDTKDLWVLDTAGLLTGATLNLTRIDRDAGPLPGQALFVGGLAAGPKPVPAGARPGVLGVLPASVENGSTDITVVINGSGFEVDVARNLPVVWLKGTLVRGTVLSGSATSLQVRFPGYTPSGDHAIVVSNGQAGGNVGSTGNVILSVRPPAAYAPTSNVVVTSFGTNKAFVFGQSNPSDPPAEITTQGGTGGLALTPDGRAAVLFELYGRPVNDASDYWGTGDSYNAAVVDLDPSHAGTFRTAVARLPFVGSAYESLAMTPDLADPDGVFAYSANRWISDTVSVIDPAACLASPGTCREIDVNPAPGSQTYPNSGDPNLGDLGSRLPAGLSRIELDAQVNDLSKGPVEVAVSPDGSRLYVANAIGGAGVSIVRASDGLALGRYTFDGNRADGDVRTVTNVAVSPNGTRLYAVGLDSVLGADSLARPFVYVYDTAITDDSEASLVGCHALPTSALPGDHAAEFKDVGRGITLAPDGMTAYVVARLRSELWVLDLTSETPGSCSAPAAIIPLKEPGAMQHALGGNYLYITNSFTSEVYVYDVAGSNRLDPQFVTTLGAACAMDVAVQPSFNAPVLSAIYPTSGPSAGGTPVTLSGHNFAPGLTVTFNGVPAADVTPANSYTITATTPAGVDGPATVRVVNPDRQFSEVAGRFRYQSDFAPPVFFTTPGMMVGTQTLVGTCPTCTVSVQIDWTTDEASDSVVGFGTTSALGQSRSSSTLVNSHSVTLTGLPTSTLHYLRVSSRDAVGNSGSSPVAPATVTFTTLALPDTTAPVIAVGPVVSVSHDSAMVQWTTNETASTEVEFDATLDGIPTTLATSASGTTHAVTLNSLAANRWYEYRVTSRDQSGNAVASSVLQFRTAQVPDAVPPDPLPLGPGEDVTLSYLSNNLVIVTWATDEPSTSFVNYGVSRVDEQGVIDITPVYRHIVFLTNLRPGTVYGFQFGSADAAGNTFLSDDPFGRTLGLSAMGTTQVKETRRVGMVTLQAGTTLAVAAATSGFTTPATADTTAPVLTSPVAITLLAPDRVLITAVTNEAASILSRFGVGGLTASAFDATFSQNQSLVLAGLTPGATYQLQVVLSDPKGNALDVSGLNFTTPSAPDTQAPQISGVAVPSLTEVSAVVVWTTDEASDGAVRYGVFGGALDRTAGSLAFGTSHSVVLRGLSAGTLYGFEVTSRDTSGNASSAGGPPFTTTFSTPTISSVIPGRGVQGVSISVAVAGSAFDPNVQIDLGAGVAIDAVSVNSTGTELLASITVSATAAIGPRTLTVTNPRSGRWASAPFHVVDGTVPQVTITQPAPGAELSSPVVEVRGTLSEPSVVTINGAAATVAADLTFAAQVRLSEAGVHRIVATATDASGNRGVTAVDVILAFVDTTPPVLSLVATPAVLSPPNHQMIEVTVEARIEDDTDPAPALVLVSVVSSEPDDAHGKGDGATINDIQDAQTGTDDRRVLLRAERAGGGPGRVYTLRYRATDRSGNSVERIVEVLVPKGKDKPPVLSLVATPAVLSPPDHQMVEVTVEARIEDDTDPAPALVLVSVVSSEPDDAHGNGDGATINDIQDAQTGTDDRRVLLRAERAHGGGPDRVYTLRYRATDRSGNSVERTVEVRVPKSKDK